jgi:hypothetical protein
VQPVELEDSGWIQNGFFMNIKFIGLGFNMKQWILHPQNLFFLLEKWIAKSNLWSGTAALPVPLKPRTLYYLVPVQDNGGATCETVPPVSQPQTKTIRRRRWWLPALCTSQVCYQCHEIISYDTRSSCRQELDRKYLIYRYNFPGASSKIVLVITGILRIC